MSPTASAIEIAGIRLTHPDKELYPEEHVAKRDLARYYEAVAERMLPHVARRLLSIVRCPDGRGEPCFFQRHPVPGKLASIHRFKRRDKKGEPDYVYVEDLPGLVALAQMGVLEIHIWGSRVDAIDRPDRMVFDLDPAEDVPFAQVKAAALHLRDILEAVRLTSFPLLTGGKGIHVVVPLQPRQGWDVVKAFSGGLAQRMSAEQPDRYVATMAKAKRKGRIFIDFFRNDKSASAIAPYSTRARAGAPLAWPLRWEALPRLKSAHDITLANHRRRLAGGDPWRDYAKTDQVLEPSALKALGIAERRNLIRRARPPNLV
jgi:bifunctional non-homologous end joining protein LigD